MWLRESHPFSHSNNPASETLYEIGDNRLDKRLFASQAGTPLECKTIVLSAYFASPFQPEFILSVSDLYGNMPYTVICRI